MYSWKDKKFTGNLSGVKLTRNFTAYAVLFAAILAMTFFGVCDPGSQNSPLSGAAADVGSESVGSGEFRRAYQRFYDQYQSAYGESFDPAAIGLPKMVLDRLIEQKIFFIVAKEAGFLAPDSEVSDQILELFKDPKTGKFSEEQLTQVMRYNGYSEASLVEELRRDLTTNGLREFLSNTAFISDHAANWTSKVDTTEAEVEFVKVGPADLKLNLSSEEIKKFKEGEGKDEIKKYYDDNIDQFRQEKIVEARHILISYKGAQRAPATVKDRSKEDAKKIAEEVLVLVSKPNTNFAKVAKEKTDEPGGAEKGGSLGSFNNKKMAPEFTKAAFAMKVDEISSELVETPFGFHIIKVENIKEEKTESLADATPTIAKDILEKKKRPELLKELRVKMDELAKEGSNKELDALITSNQLKWESTGKFKLSANSIPKLGSSDDLKNAVFSLGKAGELSKASIEDKGNLYLLRLKSLNVSDKSLSGPELADQKKTLNYQLASTLAAEVNKSKKELLEAKGQISTNKAYLEIASKQDQGG